MPNVKSAEKRVKQAAKAREINRAVRTTVKSSLKKLSSISDPESASKEAANLFSLVDKAARRLQGGFNKSKAGNYKRRAQAHLSSLSA